ncbi:SH3 domain-containing protein [Sphingomonas piscis]|uniref:SH3 domain-containing protein n=1 Tax=Sphingomonas piscis TaxID=2714943 RepID=A0A6G7YS33_9SPHN|nr:SH3 domain-containing protein [Sphingomonas piscis]QIK79544.1 SH3 domain-containing protein [Sphingomonas piscis]
MDRPPTGPSSDKHPPSLISPDGFGLEGPSDLPDPNFHAYRRDLADVSLAGQVIASHFVEPVEYTLVRAAEFREFPDESGQVIADLVAGERMRLLDCKLGWAWGYAGPEERVGYLNADALGLD